MCIYDYDDDLGEPKIGGTYRVEHPMKNFKIRIKIRQQIPEIFELFENIKDILEPNFLEEEEQTFSWQEKVFSPFEVKYNTEEKNCITDLQKKYREEILDKCIEGSRLYTQTNKDPYYPDNFLLTRPFISPLARKNERALPCLRNRKPFSQRYNKKVVDEKPPDNRIFSNHYLYREQEFMYILVDISPKSEEPSNSKDSAILLCTVTYDKVHKILTVDPDFSNEGCYKIFGTGMDYDYWIFHDSQKPSEDDEQSRLKLLKLEVKRVQAYREYHINRKFELAPSNVLRIFLNLEIISAHDFSYDSLFITYFLHLPKNWSSPCKESLTGRTQRCRMKKKKANFSYVIETWFDLDIKSMRKKDANLLWPYILLTVASVDDWQRWRIEGHGSIVLPFKSGIHDLKIHTWRPSTGFIESLRWFFTGGIGDTGDNFEIPDFQNETKLDSSLLKVTPSGYIRLRANIVHQSQSFAKDLDSRRNIFEKVSTETLMSNVEDVLAQFQIARERMIKAKAFY